MTIPPHQDDGLPPGFEPRNESEATGCGASSPELTRVLFGEVALADAAPRLRDHLHTCDACAELLRDATWLVPALSDALRPTPLSAALLTRVERDLSTTQQANHTHRVVRLALWRVPLAAAAAIAMFCCWPGSPRPAQSGREAQFAANVTLTVDDAAHLAAAFALVQWSDVAEYTVVTTESEVNDLERALDRSSDAQSLLRWSTDDDWDLPVPAGTDARPPASTAKLARGAVATPATRNPLPLNLMIRPAPSQS